MGSIRDVLSENLKALRKSRGLTQQALAESIGLTWNGYQGIEAGRRWPNLATLEKIATSLGVETSDLFEQATRGITALEALEILKAKIEESMAIASAMEDPRVRALVEEILDRAKPGWRGEDPSLRR